MAVGQRAQRAAAIVALVALLTGYMSTITEPAYAATIPSAPWGVIARGGDAVGTMTVTWQKPTNLSAASKPHYWVAEAVENGAFGVPIDTGTNKSVILPCSGATKCRFVLYASTKAGRGPGSAIATGLWATPGVPAIKSVTAGPALARMTVSINGPANTGGKAILGYLYDFQVNGAGPWVGPFAVPTLPTAQLACTSANPNGGCSYRVYARNAIGASAPSAVLAGTWAVPSAPVISVVSPGRPAHAATINWHPGPNTGGLANTYTYEVSADGGAFVAGAGPLPASPTIATVECPGVFLCSYRLTATNAKGSSARSNTVSTGYGAPTKTLNLAAYVWALNLGPGSPTVRVTWSPPANTGGSPITGYEGRRCYANCDETSSLWNFATIEQLGATPTWNTTCSAGLVTCSYQIRAINDVGPGPWGTSVRLSPFASTNVVATTAAPAGNVSVSWSGPAESGQGIDHYSLFYCVTTTGCSNSANWQNTGLVIPGTASSAVHNCGNGVECTYKVVAVEKNTGGSGAASGSAAATGSTPADAPQNLTAASGTSIGAVDLAWNPPSNAGTFPVTDYVFQRSVNSGPYSGDISVGGTTTTYTDTACGASNICTYKVAAVTAAGVGAYSNTATAEGANVPSAPLNLSATPGGAPGHVDLIWQLPSDNGGWNVSGYFIERSLDGGSTWPMSWTQGTSLSYTDTTCGAGVTCTYRVSAINARGTGPASNQATAIGTNLDPPVNLTAATSTTTLGGVLLNWGPPADDGGSPILGYEFRYKQDAGAFSAWASTGTGTGTTFTHVCFSDNVDRLCTYEVRAFTANSTSSPSNQASAQGLTDHVAPAVTVTTPADSSFVASTTPTLAGAAGNALGDSATVTVTVKSGSTIIRTFSVTRSGASWSVGAAQWASDSPSSLGNGAYTVQATQSDWAGNIGTSNTNSFTVDTVAPTVVVTAPVASVYLSSGRVTTADPTWPCTTPGICGTASDSASGVNNVKVSVRQGTGNYWDPTTSSFSSASEVFCTSATAACIVSGTTSWNVAFPIANFPAGGSYTARAVGQDNVLNSSAGTSVTFNIDYDPANTVFVATTGNSLNSGTTPAAPKPTIAEGLTVSSSTGRTALAIATGAYTGGVSISGSSLNGRRLLGGFSILTWKRVAPSSSGNGTTVSGVGTGVAVSVTTGVVIQTLDITATTSGVTGASTYGVRLDTSASATIAGVSITAGNGVAGSGGATGTAGAAGTIGGFGTNGHDGNCNDGVGGAAGTGAGGTKNGGAGGTGGCGNTKGTDGFAGNATGNGNGVSTGGSGSGSITCTNANPGGGGNGATTGGTHGSPGGSAGSVALGTATLYTPTAGGAGTTGNSGHGGGGGAGGGGHQSTFCSDPDRGGGGGGGGGGGAGGGAGSAGSGGGGSFGIYSVNSSVTLDTSLVFVNVSAGSGGVGGVGGNGANGGAGGAGGRGGGLHRTGTITDPTLSEGNNPSGSPDGGPGGGGGGGSGAGGASGAGGGAGGPSISVYHSGTGTATVGTSTLARVGGGSGGAGGTGGTSGGAGGAGPIPAGSFTTGVNAGSAGVAGQTGSAVSGATGTAGTTCRVHNGTTCTTA